MNTCLHDDFNQLIVSACTTDRYRNSYNKNITYVKFLIFIMASYNNSIKSIITSTTTVTAASDDDDDNGSGISSLGYLFSFSCLINCVVHNRLF